MRKRIDINVRFDSKWVLDEASGCHVWTSQRKGKGAFAYGRFEISDHLRVAAHRFAWERVHGPIPYGMNVCHTCDRPLCVNPAHLFLGTAKDNHADMMSKGRGNPAMGSAAGMAVLNESQVAEIKALLAWGVQAAIISRHFGVHQKTIRLIRAGRTWRHVAAPASARVEVPRGPL